MLRRRDGHLTRDLLREPGGFGLGQVPARVKPDATMDMVCGYCSTGCSLTVHLRDGEAVSLTPAVDYPVNRGVACPKGWEALAVLGGRRPGHGAAPARRGRRHARGELGCSPADDGRALPRHPGASRTGGGGVPRHRADGDRGAGAARGAGQVRDGDGARRRQHAPVHGHVGRGLQAGVRLRCAAVHVPRLRGVGRHRVRRRQTRASRIPSCGSACSGIRTILPSSSFDPARHRDGHAGHGAPGATTQVGPGAVLRRRADPESSGAGSTGATSRPTRATSIATPPPSSRSRSSGSPRRPASLRRPSGGWPRRFTGAAACRSGGRWASTRATRGCAPRRASSASR